MTSNEDRVPTEAVPPAAEADPPAADAVPPAAEPLLPAAEPGSDARNWAMFAHLSALSLFVGIPSMIGPLIIWLVKRDLHPYVDHHGKEALNFNLSFFIYAVVSGMLILLAIGLVLLPIVFVTWLVLVIIGAIKAANGEYYQYPLTIRLVS